jgi:hypothetical protein
MNDGEKDERHFIAIMNLCSSITSDEINFKVDVNEFKVELSKKNNFSFL